MRYFLDTEFYERPGRIDLISIGIVAEDGRVYYAENKLFDWTFPGVPKYLGPESETPRWLKENVKPHLLGGERLKHPHLIKSDLIAWFDNDRHPGPEFWGYYCDYDWVVFCWLFGRMIDLPSHFPKYCLDIKQLMKTFGIKREQLPDQEGTEHNAAADALWNKEAYDFIENFVREQFGGKEVAL